MNRRSFLKAAATLPLAGAVCDGEGADFGCVGLAPSARAATSFAVRDGGAFDVVVIGGSATGVFAAVRAAEQGMRVALVENNALLGGTATAGFVPVWHSMFSMNRRRIISGLTQTVVERLTARGAAINLAPNDPRSAYAATTFNSAELTVELDELVLAQKNIVPMLATRFVAADADRPGHVTRVYVEDKDGRKALSAKFFIDCSGDADLLERAGFKTWKLPPCDMQAHTLCALIGNVGRVAKRHPKFSFGAVLDPRNGGGFKHVFGWGGPVIGCADVEFNAFTRVSAIDPSIAGDLTRAMFAARAQLRRIVDHANKLFPMPAGEPKIELVAIAPMLGVRESRHAKCLYSVSRDDVLLGRTYEDVVAKGTYNIDVHEKEGIRFMRLDGTQMVMETTKDGRVVYTNSRWRPASEGVTDHYEVPYRALVPVGSENVLCAGRMIDCARDAYGALRVMVNCNQMGEAVGRAAAKAVRENLPAPRAYVGS